MHKNDNREYRTLTLPFNTQSENKRINTDYYVEGYATNFNSPYVIYEHDGINYYEVIDANALEGADVSDVIMQYDHCGKILARNANNTLGLEANERGLFIFADLSKSANAKELHEEITNGLITKMSWAFTIADQKYNAQTRTNTIFKIKKVYDVSAVSIPANNQTNINARSYIESLTKANNLSLLERRMALLKLKIKLED
ncbi:MAG: HK97 family phage prohead protease [Oscillospiraceae bacterium]